ncbi:MAG: ATPase, partial [Propionibacteriales bacterium]|nr:ATPase [Propionibacteriales bacterium]
LVRPPLLDESTSTALRDGSLSESVVAASLERVSLDAAEAAALLTEGEAHLVRQSLQEAQRGVLLTEAKAPTAELPYLSDGINLGGLFDLAEALKAAEIL